MNKASLKRLLQSFGFALCLTACQPSVNANDHSTQTQEARMSEPVTFYIGQDGHALNKTAPNSRVDKQPAGLNFYQVDWPVKAPGILRFEHGQYSFTIPNAFGVMGTEDIDLPNEHIQDFSLDFGLTTASGIAHEEARDKIFAILKDLQAKGWKRYIYRSSARLKGKETWVADDGSYFSLDTSYVPTMKEWMSLTPRPSFMFYADGVILDFTFERDSERMDVNQLGGYFLTMNISSERLDLRQMSGYGEWTAQERKERDWRAFLPAALKEAKATRAAEEAKLRKEGYHIDETYQDPPISKEFLIDPQSANEYGTQPTAKFGDVCPATGMWYCKNVTTEQGIFMRKGDPMPGQSYRPEEREAMVWSLVKNLEQS
jgi:hypothetical protein